MAFLFAKTPASFRRVAPDGTLTDGSNGIVTVFFVYYFALLAETLPTPNGSVADGAEGRGTSGQWHRELS